MPVLRASPCSCGEASAADRAESELRDRPTEKDADGIRDRAVIAAYGFLASAIAFNMLGHLMFKFGATVAADTMRAYVSPFTILGMGVY